LTLTSFSLKTCVPIVNTEESTNQPSYKAPEKPAKRSGSVTGWIGWIAAVVVALTGLLTVVPGFLDGVLQLKDKVSGLFPQEAEVKFEVASADLGETPGRILIYDGDGGRRYDVPGTFGSRVLGCSELHMFMPKISGQPGYWGYLKAERDPNFPNRIQLVGAMYQRKISLPATVIVRFQY
jgi:hypothetical protein